ncbi:MAG: selenocysteine-specific translation elongation factor [Syntrophomonas sp.]|uniref:selenocysteine-specific translation elongation factor n=1 Tax=Syntrophomonas sp. TaxID=2053627 RepID=UPI00262D943B|nr:selenocysteine-specific translation elongation factor [Syntrophomonas sp.]MDD2510585.1 selenocysteine-specific translation elongation factor [Syntrophomonas sp.]MDD3879108.1 selenocysteine-specific translation elongation factor [Syntrophomonas sp.]MDD4626294.1 selenocysteine-specific translation elongation factor [Syntrophomonas sp.]
MKRLIIGTAGHIDHGKTTLVRALTGVDTDRLKEEKQRGISIELGFAPFMLPGGQKAAIVDVPGHERFIRHMLAGAFGIDMVVFVIAADEGIMPQTREHLDIIELLGVNQGVVAITKKDLVDEEWLMLMEEEIKEYLAGTALKNSPMIAVSAISGEGIEQLLEEIEKMAAQVKEKPVVGQARLPIDRVFTIAGFGTVVTGTLWSGQIKTGESLELMPVQRPVKVRSLQVHGAKVAEALAGQRVAVNLQGIEVAEIKRGYLLSTPDYLRPSYRVDTRLRLLSSSKRTLRNWNRIRFHLGTEEALGRVVLLDRDELQPGQESYAQIVMEKAVVCQKGDPFVIRYYSPVTTIGGGGIIDPHAPKQKRFREEVLDQLVMKEEGSLYDLILQEMEAAEATFISADLARKTGHEEEQIKEELEQLLLDEKVGDLKNGEYMSNRGLKKINEEIRERLKEYHRQYPLRAGYPREEMRSRFFKSINTRSFNAIMKCLEDRGSINSQNNQLRLAGYSPEPGEKESHAIEKIRALMDKELFTPPSLEDLKQQLELNEENFGEVISYLLNQGLLIKLSGDIFFSTRAIEEGKKILEEHFSREKELSLATARDLFNTSRRYTLPLLEYYDKSRFTRRIGDIRVKA